MLENCCQMQGQPWGAGVRTPLQGCSDYFLGVFIDVHESKFLENRKHLYIISYLPSTIPG